MDKAQEYLKEELETSYIQYLSTEDIKDKGLYLRALKEYNQYAKENNLPLEESKVIIKNKTLDRTIDVNVDDSPDQIDGILEGDVIDW